MNYNESRQVLMTRKLLAVNNSNADNTRTICILLLAKILYVNVSYSCCVHVY